MTFRHFQDQRELDVDHATSRTICEAVAERLRQNLKPEPRGLPSHLQALIDEMHRREH